MMTLVKALKPFVTRVGTDNVAPTPGTTVMLPKEKADALIKAGLAEVASQPTAAPENKDGPKPGRRRKPAAPAARRPAEPQ